MRVDGVDAASLDDLRRQGSVFIFVPESLLLVKGSPARRRAHLDAFAAALDPAYEAGLRDLNVVLRQRNAQLFRVRDGAPADSLDAWDRQLARVALRSRSAAAPWSPAWRRASATSRPPSRPTAASFRSRLVSQLDDLPPIAAGGDATAVSATAVPRARGRARGGLPAALRARRAGEVGRATSAYGPHRDDLRFVEETSAPPAAVADAQERSPAAAGAGPVGATCAYSARRASSVPPCSPCCSPSGRSPPTRPATSAPSSSTT